MYRGTFAGKCLQTVEEQKLWKQKDIINPNIENMGQLSRGNGNLKTSKQECCLSNNQLKYLHRNSISRISDLTVFRHE
jgi:CobQ-like glutamine amidotransferase family enzyme